MRSSRFYESISYQGIQYISGGQQCGSQIHKRAKRLGQEVCVEFDEKGMLLYCNMNFIFINAAIHGTILTRTSGFDPSSTTRFYILSDFKDIINVWLLANRNMFFVDIYDESLI